MSGPITPKNPSVNTYEKFEKAIKSENPPITGRLASYAEELFANNKIGTSGAFSSNTIKLSTPEADGAKDQEIKDQIKEKISNLVEESLAWSTMKKVGSALRNFSFYSTATRLLKATHDVLAIQKKGNGLILAMNKITDQTDPNFQITKRKLESILYTLSTLVGTTSGEKLFTKDDFEKLKKNAELAINSVPSMKQEDLIKGLAAPYSSKTFSAIGNALSLSSFFISSAHKDLRKLSKDRYDALLKTLKTPPDDQKEQYKAALNAILGDIENLNFIKIADNPPDLKSSIANSINNLIQTLSTEAPAPESPPPILSQKDRLAVFAGKTAAQLDRNPLFDFLGDVVRKCELTIDDTENLITLGNLILEATIGEADKNLIIDRYNEIAEKDIFSSLLPLPKLPLKKVRLLQESGLKKDPSPPLFNNYWLNQVIGVTQKDPSTFQERSWQMLKDNLQEELLQITTTDLENLKKLKSLVENKEQPEYNSNLKTSIQKIINDKIKQLEEPLADDS